MHVYTEDILKLLLAICIGGAIGLERELRSKSAGFRTLMLVCLGATLFTIFSRAIGGSGSADRIAANVVVGIGFLGAGVIFRGNTLVNGITTAASMWLAAALGVGIGSGAYLLSVVGCIFVVAILFLFSYFDNVLGRLNQVREYRISFPYEAQQQHKYEELMKAHGLIIKSQAYSKTGNIITGSWAVKGNELRHHAFIEQILNDNMVTEFAF